MHVTTFETIFAENTPQASEPCPVTAAINSAMGSGLEEASGRSKTTEKTAQFSEAVALGQAINF